MSVQIGAGRFSYAVDVAWARAPTGWLVDDVAAVGVDAHDRVFVFNRGPHPMLVFDRDGSFLGSWGEEIFRHPHGIEMAPDGSIVCTDDGDHTVRRCSPDGEVLLELGTANEPAPFMSGRPFHRCTHTATTADGTIYVTDGYGNYRVHRYAGDGRLLDSWGAPGAAPGEFNLPHAIVRDEDGTLLVADRENHRIQLFDGDGTYRGEWRNLHRPACICPLPGDEPAWLIGESGPGFAFNRGAPNIGPRLSILDRTGQVVTRLGTSPAAGAGPGQFLSPHGVAVDSHGDIYVAQVGCTAWPRLFGDAPRPASLPNLVKLVRAESR